LKRIGPWPLTFLYVAFVRLLQLVRLSWGEREDLAIEVVMLRHEVPVLGRRVGRPALRPRDRAVLAAESTPFVDSPRALSHPTGDPAAMASRSCPQTMDLPAPTLEAAAVAERDRILGFRPAKENPIWG
jgi:hypothetical protein